MKMDFKIGESSEGNFEKAKKQNVFKKDKFFKDKKKNDVRHTQPNSEPNENDFYRKMGVPFEVSKITFKFANVVSPSGEFLNNYSVYDAKKIAKENGLHLVCFNCPSDRTQLPLCKILDFGKWKYNEEKAKKQKEKGMKNELKEVRFTPVISENDVAHKVKQVNEFIADGSDVVLFMKLKNRQKNFFNLALKKMDEIVGFCVGKEISRKTSDSTIIVKMTKN